LMFYRGDLEQATALLREVRAQHPNLRGVQPLLGLCLSAQGEHDAALAELDEEVLRTAAVDADTAYSVASLFALEGRLDDAFAWLRRSMALGNENRFWFEHDPNLDALRADERFAEVMRSVANA
ncbi:MAG TPA: hypothetical protein VE961_11050, partial [Pyrinomonadaceae bacterium]|nr:hypothetical protein [Pyrinomonadaceae bacterium]